MSDDTEYQFTRDIRDQLNFDWAVVPIGSKVVKHDYWIANEDSTDRDPVLVDADLATIRHIILDDPMMADVYHYRPFSQMIGLALTDQELFYFRLRFLDPSKN